MIVKLSWVENWTEQKHNWVENWTELKTEISQEQQLRAEKNRELSWKLRWKLSWTCQFSHLFPQSLQKTLISIFIKFYILLGEMLWCLSKDWKCIYLLGVPFGNGWDHLEWREMVCCGSTSFQRVHELFERSASTLPTNVRSSGRLHIAAFW